MESISIEMRERVETILNIDYSPYTDPYDMKAQIDNTISYEWIDKYQKQCEEKVSALSIVIDGYTFLWDETYERVVAVYGMTTSELLNAVKPREKSRTAYYYRNFVKRFGETKYDTGHFIAHSIGGRMDINLFPQKRDINRGYSKEGSIYRKMENYAKKHPETLVLSRPIYFDDTWRPFFLEYGVWVADSGLSLKVFDNI